VEDEFDAWLGRARYERRRDEDDVSEDGGLRNGFRARRVQTAEGELAIEIPQVRQAAGTFRVTSSGIEQVNADGTVACGQVHESMPHPNSFYSAAARCWQSPNATTRTVVSSGTPGGGHRVAGRQLVGRRGRNGFGCKLRLMSGWQAAPLDGP
jgi:Transposase, Mutator family